MLKLFNRLLSRRLSLEDLRFSPTDRLALRSFSKGQRQALLSALEHSCLTSYPECCRKTAVKLRDYLMKESLDQDNKLEFDQTLEDVLRQQSKKYFRRP